MEILREPLESGHILISRAARSAVFPARFQLVTAMNPCPCGWAGDRSNRCLCTSERIQRYRGRVSGPLLDRIDLHVTVMRLSPEELREGAPAGECSADVRARVIAARVRQLASGALNAHLDSKALRACASLVEADQGLLDQAIKRLQLSARAMHRILRVTRTIADIAGCEDIGTEHLAEAIGYRQLDRGALGRHLGGGGIGARSGIPPSVARRYRKCGVDAGIRITSPSIFRGLSAYLRSD
ncbi:ATP-binding protein [Stenotrophomonas sp. CFBP 13718]|nr:ATP-binding protein [Stenotrophomonas sp. CFBP 13718]